MPINRNALIRYRAIDRCLQNRYRKWTLEDLIEACSEALYEFEGIAKGISRRSVQADIQAMRSEKLGYNAPIIVLEKKYYAYEDPNYSITQIPLTGQDLDTLEVLKILEQFKGFTHFAEIGGMLRKFEDKVHRERGQQKAAIHFEKNEELKGLAYLDTLYKCVLQQEVIGVQYQSFKAATAQAFHFHPYLLKEFRNRWFLLGRRGQENILTTLALDRIQSLSPAPEVAFSPMPDFDSETYFNDIIGVTKNTGEPVADVRLHVNAGNAPYVETKPMHASQEVITRHADGSIDIRLRLRPNFELERDILGFGETMQVLAPERLRERIRARIAQMAGAYMQTQSSSE
jgi:predicted DNA-binding transcriptional regulator YafY